MHTATGYKTAGEPIRRQYRSIRLWSSVRFSQLAMNKPSFLIQELLGLPEKSSDVAVPPTLEKQVVDDERELQGTSTNGCKRSREDVNSVGDEIPSPEGSLGAWMHAKDNFYSKFHTSFPCIVYSGEILQGAAGVSSTTVSPSSATKSTKRLRTAFTSWQLRELEYAFRMCPYPDSSFREQIASTTGIEETKIQVTTKLPASSVTEWAACA